VRRRLFVESICDDPEILHRNYAMKLQNDGQFTEPSLTLAAFT
jgi:hypothetical protein